MPGKSIIIAAPSGSGKTTLVHYLMDTLPELCFSVSATCRPPRGEEKHGEDYYFLDESTFRQKANAGEFLEWEEVYPGQLYGTLRQELDRIWHSGRQVIFDVDVLGALNLKREFGARALAVFIMPPSTEELQARLRHRHTESEEKIAMRVAKAREEMAYAKDFDRVVVNDILADAQTELTTLVRDFLNTPS